MLGSHLAYAIVGQCWMFLWELYTVNFYNHTCVLHSQQNHTRMCVEVVYGGSQTD